MSPITWIYSQLDDEIAIVEVDGKEKFFDPGERYAGFGNLHWKHAATEGIRQIDRGTALLLTPSPVYQSTSELRSANLEIQPDGKVNGSIRIALTGAFALRWREFALSNGEDALKQQFTALVQAEMPAGIEVKTDHFLGLTDWTTNFMAVLSVTGSMGTHTAGSVLLLPATFFESTSHPFFALDKRTSPLT